MGNADKRPLISVIVPVYNVEKYLRACVDSIIAQTYDNLEIILVDDGSPDNCPAICDEYAEKEQRVKVVHKNNVGVSAARNDGLLYSTGKYIMFIDSDDTVSSNWIEGLYESIQTNDFVIAGVTYVKNGEKNPCVPDDRNLVKLIKNSLFGYMCNKLYKRESLIGQEFCSGLREDLLFNLSLIRDGMTYAICDNCGYFYYQRHDSLLHAISVPELQTVYDFESQIGRIIRDLDNAPKKAIYNIVMYSYVTDYVYKLLLSKNISGMEKKCLVKKIVSYYPLKKLLEKEYADNMLYRILYYGIALQSSFIIRYGFGLCQKR